MENLVPLLGIFGIFIAPLILAGFVVYYKGKNDHTERLKMIEQGMRPDPKGSDIAAKKKYKSMESGIFFLSVALGLLAGVGIKNALALDGVLAFFITIPFFVGIGNIILYYMIKKDDNNLNEEIEA